MAALGRRATCVRAIRNAHAFTERDNFDAVPVLILQERLNRLRQDHDEFREQHNALLEGEDNDDTINAHNQLFDEIIELYFQTHGIYNARIVELLRDNAADANADNMQHEQADAQNNDANAPPGNGEVLPPPMQNQPAQHFAPALAQNAVPLMQQLQADARLAAPILEPQRPEQFLDVNQIPNVWGEFDGSRDKWQPFRDRFLASVHNNVRIPAIYKYQLLKKAVIGSAADVLGDWQLAAENYDMAWQMLREAYDDDYLIRRSYLDALFGMAKMKCTSEAEIRRLINVTRQSVRQLMALDNQQHHNWDSILVYMLVARLDDATAREWELSRPNNNPTLNELITFLERQARGLAHVVEFDPQEVNMLNEIEYRANRINNQGGERCKMCRAFHLLGQCNRFLTLPLRGRRELVKRKNLCFGCYQSDHRTNYCPHGRCKRCNDGTTHHSTICPSHPRYAR